MSEHGSKMTSFGMRRWYMNIPRCTQCKKVKLTRHIYRNLQVCGDCLEKLTGKTAKEISDIVWKTIQQIKYPECIKVAEKRELQFVKAYIDTPVQVETGEWWFKGCFIQEQPTHPSLAKYRVFIDDENQTHIGTSDTYLGAVDLCHVNKNYKQGLENLIW